MKTSIKNALYALLILITGHVVAADANESTTQVVSHVGRYNVYHMHDQDLSGDLGYNVDGQTQVSAIELAKRLVPINVAQAAKDGVLCDFLCEDPHHNVVGYDPKVLIEFKQLAAKHH